MDFKEYQILANRTAATHEQALTNYGLGIAGEAGEVADLIKKYAFHGHDLDKDALTKELGDVLWYVSQIAKWADISMETVAELNIEKLKLRYPQGFSAERSKLHID
ncbi:nucleotide pyrophosphohydrolase [Listeria monocytogenes]|uniref:Nucleotide pyrophosphohydrolase n=1 Tax=Listeria monocytogenes TaxID=1639 RepID=A0A7U7TUH6_LISMN|nr:nucleoside triphosphate pyrophosphohydrolase family protein [Listeria monocytogenes]MDA18332.1 nucleotide pyrophosphohydrolase [Listeria monocytogenes serotype 4a]EAC4811665.1 nucleotide pyrophosphohydrolase [Listeria monocytogenes]EAC7279922.1 nucleotide pyrophosphohydrolase [Listeria monocytogenes]EAC7286446.1 nucleotide pyrophosphohydrolase [Listeria monocytogenes]EAC7297077.1 nucleotide pyrophosphohydrolase [Listeria monocytogenes]